MIIYNNCRELPIHNFFEINRTNDLLYLVKSGEAPDASVLQDKFLDIIDEYNSLFTGNKKPGTTNKSKFYILTLKLLNLEIVEQLIQSRGITEEVREVARKLKIKPEKLSDYITGLKSELRKLQNELEQPDENTEDISYSLEKTLTLVKENGFNFDRFTTPVIEFVFAINRLEEKSKHQKAKNSNK